MFKNYLLVAIRNIWRNKTFSAINIVGLSLGLACCMLIVLYTRDEQSFDGFHAKKDRIYRITNTSTSPEGVAHKTGITGIMQGPAFTAAIPEVETFVRYNSTGFTVKQGDEVIDQPATFVDSNFFQVFSFPLLKGNPATALKEPHSVVLTEALAKKYFGKEDPMGKILELKNGEQFEPFQVTGVAAGSPENSSIQLNMMVPFRVQLGQSTPSPEEWLNSSLNTFLLLKPAADPVKAAAKFDPIFETLAAAPLKMARDQYNWHDKMHYDLQPFTDIHLSKDFGTANGLEHGSNPVYSYILSGIAVLLLVIACINFINLTIARSLKRAKEIGIRKVVGGQKQQLILQFLGETFLLCLLSFVFAVFLVQLVLPVFNSLSNKALSFSYLIDARLVGYYFLLLVLTALLAGCYPAFVLSGFNPVQTLYGRFRFSGRNILSKSLLVLQFSLASLLIIASLVLSRQFKYLTEIDLGYDDSQVAVLQMDRVSMQKWPVIREELKKIPEIAGLTVDQGGNWSTIARINQKTDQQFDFKIVDDQYFSLLKIPFVQGRNFDPAQALDTANGAIVNESFVKVAGWKNPIGETVDFFYKDKKYQVIGVIRDYHFGSLTEKIRPQLFVANPEYSYHRLYVKFREGKMAAGQPALAASFRKLFPFQPYDFRSLEEQNYKQYGQEARWRKIITGSTLLTIFISCIGLFGMATLNAEKRTKEIGIRKVLGASVPAIVRTLSVDFLKLVLLSALIAAPLAWWAMQKWLDNYPYRIELHWSLFLLTMLLVVLLALGTIASQTIRAALSNPVNSLKTE